MNSHEPFPGKRTKVLFWAYLAIFVLLAVMIWGAMDLVRIAGEAVEKRQQLISEEAAREEAADVRKAEPPAIDREPVAFRVRISH